MSFSDPYVQQNARSIDGFDHELSNSAQLPKEPVVSVHMCTYQHAAFIREAIEGVLLQKTDFPIELCIGEDGSTDGTREICVEYQKRYPHLIRLFLRDRNNPARQNYDVPYWHNGLETLKSCRGKYIAFCEGDDYWTEMLKLQWQVEFLDTHPEYSICAHRVMHINHDHPEIAPYPSPIQKETGTLEDILRADYLPTPSVVYRAGLVGSLPRCFQHLLGGDWPLWVLLAEHGKIGFVNDIMAHYRVHGGGVWMGISLEAKMASVKRTLKAIHKYAGNRYPTIHRLALMENHLSGAWHYKWQNRCDKASIRLVRAFASHPFGCRRSEEAGRLANELTRHYFVASGIKRVIDGYHQARIRAGAKRRRVWSNLIHVLKHATRGGNR